MTVAYACGLNVYACMNFRDEILLRGRGGGGGGGVDVKPGKNRIFLKNGKTVNFLYSTC